MTSDLTPIDATADGGVLGYHLHVGDDVRIYPGGRYGEVTYIKTTTSTPHRTVVGVATNDGQTGDHDPYTLRRVFPPDPTFAPGDRIQWTAGNGTVRVGTVLSWAEDTGTWFVAIDPDPHLLPACKGYKTWFRPADLVKVESCARCHETPAVRPCCSAHNANLCHQCYRRTHFVEVCSAGCAQCAAEGLPVILPRRQAGE